jgi:8-oxo-dGTP pyrophosphatase MutT (NUDIX family)
MWKRMLVIVRARWDYARYLVASEMALLLAVVGTLFGVASLLPELAGLIIGVLGFVVGAASLTEEVWGLRQRWNRFELVSVVSNFPETVEPPAELPDARYVRASGRGTMLVDWPTGARLSAEAIPAVLDVEAYRLPAALREVAPHALRQAKRGALFFNGDVLCLMEDPAPRQDALAQPIALQRGTFFDAVCSNELCRYRVVNRATGEETDVRARELVTQSGRLVSLAESRLANMIGVSTIAITADGYMLYVHQSNRNTASQSMLAPAGSGTAEPSDVPDRPDFTLQEVIVTAMERELREETGVLPGDIAETTLTGYGRWLERGAKPEFFGTTRLTITGADAMKRTITSSEGLYTRRKGLIRVDVAALADAIKHGSSVMDAAATPDLIKDTGSLPLLAAMEGAARAARLEDRGADRSS